MNLCHQTFFGSYRPSRRARLRLFCFPFAGGSVSLFREWQESLGTDIDVCAVHLPGRDPRQPSPFKELIDLTRAMAQFFPPLLDIPAAFFGHSLGGLIAFELARELQTAAILPLVHLFISARSAPHLHNDVPSIAHMSDNELAQEMQARYQGIPSCIFDDKELMQLVLPVLRRDLMLLDGYIWAPGSSLSCPLSVFGGTEDMEVPRHGLECWRGYTTGTFSLRMIPGGHFFVQSARELLIRHLSEDLANVF